MVFIRLKHILGTKRNVRGQEGVDSVQTSLLSDGSAIPAPTQRMVDDCFGAVLGGFSRPAPTDLVAALVLRCCDFKREYIAHIMLSDYVRNRLADPGPLCKFAGVDFRVEFRESRFSIRQRLIAHSSVT